MEYHLRRIDIFLEASWIGVPVLEIVLVMPSFGNGPLSVTSASCQSSTLLMLIACLVATGHLAGRAQ
jgi:hypothetical protein